MSCIKFGTIKERIFAAADARNWDAKRLRYYWAIDRNFARKEAVRLAEEAFRRQHPDPRECGYYIDTGRLGFLGPGNCFHTPMTAESVANFVLEDICGFGIIPVEGIQYPPHDRRSQLKEESDAVAAR